MTNVDATAHDTEVDDEPAGLSVGLYPGNLDDAECWRLLRLAEKATRKAAAFGHWLQFVAIRELQRRASAVVREVEFVRLPADLTDRDIGQALLAVYAITAVVSTPELAAWCDRLLLLLSVEADYRLEKICH